MKEKSQKFFKWGQSIAKAGADTAVAAVKKRW